MTLRPKGTRNLLWISSKSTHDWLIDGRMPHFDDILILFMKMEMKSCSRLGFKHQQKQFLGPFSSYILTNTIISRIMA